MTCSVSSGGNGWGKATFSGVTGGSCRWLSHGPRARVGTSQSSHPAEKLECPVWAPGRRGDSAADWKRTTRCGDLVRSGRSANCGLGAAGLVCEGVGEEVLPTQGPAGPIGVRQRDEAGRTQQWPLTPSPIVSGLTLSPGLRTSHFALSVRSPRR